MKVFFLAWKFELRLRDDRLSSWNISRSLSCFLTVPEVSSDRYCQRKDYRDLWSDRVLLHFCFHLFISFQTLAALKPMPQKTLWLSDTRQMAVVAQVWGLHFILCSKEEAEPHEDWLPLSLHVSAACRVNLIFVLILLRKYRRLKTQSDQHWACFMAVDDRKTRTDERKEMLPTFCIALQRHKEWVNW